MKTRAVRVSQRKDVCFLSVVSPGVFSPPACSGSHLASCEPNGPPELAQPAAAAPNAQLASKFSPRPDFYIFPFCGKFHSSSGEKGDDNGGEATNGRRREMLQCDRRKNMNNPPMFRLLSLAGLQLSALPRVMCAVSRESAGSVWVCVAGWSALEVGPAGQRSEGSTQRRREEEERGERRRRGWEGRAAMTSEHTGMHTHTHLSLSIVVRTPIDNTSPSPLSITHE